MPPLLIVTVPNAASVLTSNVYVRGEVPVLMALFTVSVIGCCAHGSVTALAGVAGRGATIVAPVRASVVVAAVPLPAPVGLVGLGLDFSQAIAAAQSTATPATLIFLLSMCTYRPDFC
jgi:hypothetical protein